MTMQKQLIKHPYIAIEPGISKGSPIIAGTRVRVLDIIIEYEYLGFSPDEIINAHPHLNLPQVHDALSFYYEHREELDQEIRQRKEKMKELCKKLTS
ncbi:MAG: DUF433 domain-containing protein [Candidatus Methanoperedens sp.]|nr:DUF433 domain-containing protein [Candidatus Methanoperedens sp.]MCZ7359699.1 DUF433 domain-containing protein [Candidatus Methanoperedens sp.]HLB69677.1 DUF433 domain-containing protein [Candidatus Methanoperedens sp.]